MGIGQDTTQNVLWRIEHGILDYVKPKVRNKLSRLLHSVKVRIQVESNVNDLTVIKIADDAV